MFKQIILDNQELIKNIEIIKRDYEFFDDLLLLKKIVSFVWPRRTWKTFLMYHFVKQLIKNWKIELNQVVFIDFSLYSWMELDANILLENYKELFPNKEPFFVFDEIQDISNFKNFVLLLYNKQFQIFLSWSNSNLLSSELTTHFRWRIFQYNVLPLTFVEVLNFNNFPYKKNYSTLEKAKIQNILKDILEYWTFPEIVLSKNNLFKIDNLKTYLDILIYKDLLERYKIDNEFSLRYLIKSLTLWFTKQVNITKIYNELKSQNIKIWKTTLFDYYQYIKNIFYIFEVENYYSQKWTKECFLYNLWFNKLLWNKINYWQSFENIIFLELKKKYEKVFYKKNGSEIDFFIEEGKINIQVCYELNLSNLEREIKPFLKNDNEKNILIYNSKETWLNIPDKIKALNFMEFILFINTLK